MMEACAKVQSWPQNDTSCDMWGGCPFRSVCSRPPASREQWIAAEFTTRLWDPLQVRGPAELS